MKLSIDVAGIVKVLGYENAIKCLKEVGFDAFDYGFYDESEVKMLLSDDYKEYYKKIREVSDLIGCECIQAHAPFPVEYGSDLKNSNDMYFAVVRSIEAAAILGAKNIVIHPVVVPDGEDELKVNKVFYKSLQLYAMKYKIKIAIENLYKRDIKRRTFKDVLGTPQKMRTLIDELGADCFVMCLDTGHSAITGVEPEEYIQGMNNKYLKALHIHDTDYLDDTHTLPYLGRHNWDEFCDALVKIDYQGDFNFEVPYYLSAFNQGMLYDALVFAEKIGRSLIAKIERRKK